MLGCSNNLDHNIDTVFRKWDNMGCHPRQHRFTGWSVLCWIMLVTIWWALRTLFPDKKFNSLLSRFQIFCISLACLTHCMNGIVTPQEDDTCICDCSFGWEGTSCEIELRKYIFWWRCPYSQFFWTSELSNIFL